MKSKGLRIILIIIIVFLVAIQFIHPARNIAAGASPGDISTLHPVPDSVAVVLRKACYDCHSNNTRYPWYFNIQPVAWWMSDHINEGKHELNFSEFANYPVNRQVKKLKRTVQEVQKGDMPLNSYTWIHKDAVLTDQEKNLVIDWAKGLSAEIVRSSPSAQ